jgi:radical SAM superfamily enzyme YgiQ (UPF0313 family)
VSENVPALAVTPEQDPPEILLLFPTFLSGDFSDAVFSYHLGAGYLLAYLKAKRIPAKQFVYMEPIDLHALTDNILSQNPRIVGFTCYDTNYHLIKLISQMLKRKNPEVLNVIGGPSATFSDELLLTDNPALDICVRGEGEATLYDLANRLRTSLDVSDIAGITYRSNSTIVHNPDRPLLRGQDKTKELDILPSPYLAGVLPADEQLGITTSRGCVFKCTYCNFAAMSRWTIRYHSVERVISELQTIHRALQNKKPSGSEAVPLSIHDDTFSLNIERAKRICRSITQHKIDMPLWADLRADRVDRELLVLMQQAGVKKVNIGLESAAPRVLRTVKKVRDSSVRENGLEPERAFVEKVRRGVKLAKEVGLEISVSTILGLPGATEDDDRTTIDFVKQLEVADYSHNYLRVLSGTELFTSHRTFGLEMEQSLLLLPRQTRHAYDVHKIPMMAHSMHSRMVKEYMQRTLAMITGDYGKRPIGAHPDLLLRNRPLGDDVIQWLQSLMAIGPRMLFFDGDGDETVARRNMERIIQSGLPVVSFSLAELAPVPPPSPNPRAERDDAALPKVNAMIDEAKLLKLRGASFGVLDSYGIVRLGSPSTQQNIGSQILLALSTLDQMKTLSSFVFSSSEVVLESYLAEYSCCFLDECRWLSDECPAVTFRRAVIHKDGFGRPCFNGAEFGEIEDSREDIAKRLQALWSDTKRERGCDTCSEAAKCAKCLFPFPMHDEEYCQIIRGEHRELNGIDSIFKLLSILRRIESRFDTSARDRKVKRIEAMIDVNGLSMVDMAGRRYFYHHGSDRLYRGGGFGAEG